MSFQCNKLVVIGAGLIGGSMIKALRKTKSEVGEIVAVGRNLNILKAAQKSGYIDAYSNNATDSVIDADIVIIGTPVGTMQQQFEKIYPNLARDCIVSDVGSVKKHVVDVARKSLKDKIHAFVPAHPISGTEHSGFDASFAELFQDRFTILTPLEENKVEDVNKIRSLWQTIGSEILEMSLSNHDRVFAATSHLPHVLVYSLMNTISQLDDSDKYFQVVAGGFLDYTRIASSDAVMWRDVCLTNQQPILEMIGKYKSQLSALEKMIEHQDAAGLQQQFVLAKQKRDELVDKRQKQKQDQHREG